MEIECQQDILKSFQQMTLAGIIDENRPFRLVSCDIVSNLKQRKSPYLMRALGSIDVAANISPKTCIGWLRR